MHKGNIVITGVSTGIGYDCLKRFVQEGFCVFGSVRKQEDADRLKEEFGRLYEPLIFDVTDRQSINKEIDRVHSIWESEGVKCLINNSGIVVHGPIELLEVDDYRKQFEVNFFGLIEMTKACLPYLGTMKDFPFKKGKIINISSVAGKNALPFLTPYSTSKAAVDRFSEGLRRELMMFGIDVVTFNPGPIKTPIWEKVEEPSEEVMKTAYGKPLSNFIRFFHKESKDAVPVEVLTNKIYKAFCSNKPRTSQIIMRSKFLKYNIPNMLLSVRNYEKLLQKILKLKL